MEAGDPFYVSSSSSQEQDKDPAILLLVIWCTFFFSVNIQPSVNQCKRAEKVRQNETDSFIVHGHGDSRDNRIDLSISNPIEVKVWSLQHPNNHNGRWQYHCIVC